jgi:diguanylate cyclase (GGDEF)-like protein
VSSFFSARSALTATLDAKGDGKELNPLERSSTTYVDAVSEFLAATEAQKFELAEQIDETQVDPGFERIIELVESNVRKETERASEIERGARVLTIASTLGMTSMLGILLLLTITSRERRRGRELQTLAAQRFQAIVENSEDFFTVVDQQQSLSIVSPTLGPFRGIASSSDPVRVDEILPAEAFAQWLSLDDRLVAIGGRQHGEFEILHDSGSRVWLEAHGTALGPTERAWVWHDITKRKELELQLTHQAFHDALTGVANRSLLHDRVQHALAISVRSASPVNLLFCDLDDFKTINDTLGHAEGDALLNTITKRIQGCVRERDTVARLGGDEFAFLLEDTDPQKALALAERLVSVVGFEVKLAGRIIYPSVSIGIASATPTTTTDELLRNADLAMYSAKRAGKGRSAVPGGNAQTLRQQACTSNRAQNRAWER